jgi:cobyrinic acid a,c-diamide synthase
MDFPRLVIAALRGGSGKTILSIGIIAAWKKLGKQVSSFKKGPDYIDAGWLALAAGRPCYNLDTFLIEKEHVLHSFLIHSKNCDISVIEGNRGLYDGIDLVGSTSTAELVKLLKAPVIICIDATKTTRTMAAAVLGCMKFDPDVEIKGVILNRVAGPRHEKILRRSIEYYCNIPVLGAVPKLDWQNFPERHMGLIPTPEHTWAQDSINDVSVIADRYIDLDALAEIARNAAAIPLSSNLHQNIQHPRFTPAEIPSKAGSPIFSDRRLEIRIGIIKDSAFQFYYPENIEALEAAGAQIIFISPLSTDTIPPVDALYIGGGFPETHAQQLAQNIKFREQLKSLAEEGLPIYAECGGLMYLGEELVLDNDSYPMAGVLPIVFDFSKKPEGHGYTIITVEKQNPYFTVGAQLKGHEFHYSRVLDWRGDDNDLVFAMQRGTGFINKRDGVLYKNVLATYTHMHALGVPSWAEALVRNAMSYKAAALE